MAQAAFQYVNTSGSGQLQLQLLATGLPTGSLAFNFDFSFDSPAVTFDRIVFGGTASSSLATSVSGSRVSIAVTGTVLPSDSGALATLYFNKAAAGVLDVDVSRLAFQDAAATFSDPAPLSLQAPVTPLPVFGLVETTLPEDAVFGWVPSVANGDPLTFPTVSAVPARTPGGLPPNTKPTPNPCRAPPATTPHPPTTRPPSRSAAGARGLHWGLPRHGRVSLAPRAAGGAPGRLPPPHSADTPPGRHTDGGNGTDTMSYTQARTALQVGRVDGSLRVVGPDSVDVLNSIEILRFASQSVGVVEPPRETSPAYGADNRFLFDPTYYLLANWDLVPALTMAGASDHFFASGGAEGRQPASWFNAQFYAHRYPDLAAYAGAPALLFAHYNLFGVWEGRAANVALQSFDGTRYLADNPDVAQYVQANLADFRGSTDNGAIAHFVIYGEHEGRSAFTEAGVEITFDFLI
ncbi:MAG: hypothetical protein IPM01_31450 [Burkholderiaceae bacterium]|nr:hypothetical protein [Burkholderiaceae bacterium]